MTKVARVRDGGGQIEGSKVHLPAQRLSLGLVYRVHNPSVALEHRPRSRGALRLILRRQVLHRQARWQQVQRPQQRARGVVLLVLGGDDERRRVVDLSRHHNIGPVVGHELGDHAVGTRLGLMGWGGGVGG